METPASASDTSTGVARLRNRRIGAILAGGLVLGIGAAVTLAAWNDSEFATGEFAAGSFNLEGSTNGTDYTDNDTEATAATLDFSVVGENLSPGDVTYAPFAVRLDADTDYSATVSVANAGTTGTVSGLTYSVVQPTAFGCDDTTVGDELIPAGTALGAVPADITFALTAGADADPGDPVFLCYAITAGETLEQSQAGTATWEFAAESQ